MRRREEGKWAQRGRWRVSESERNEGIKECERGSGIGGRGKVGKKEETGWEREREETW